MASALAEKSEKKGKSEGHDFSGDLPGTHSAGASGAPAGLPAFLTGLPVQARLTVNTPGDAYEQEADKVADIATRPDASSNGTPRISRMPRYGAVHRSSVSSAAVHAEASDPELTARITSPGSGSPLPGDLRTHMEGALGKDLSGVRVHDNAADRRDADRLNARAFTHGQDIWIGSAGSVSDRKLLAHELTHVVQQTGGGTGAVQRREAAPEDEIASSAAEPVPEGQNSSSDLAPVPNPDASAPTASPEHPAPEGAQDLAPSAALNGGPALDAPPSPLPLAPKHESAVPAAAPAALPAIQRDDNDDGFIGSIKRRITGIADSLRGGWTSLSLTAQSAFQSVTGFVGGLVSGLSSVVSSALAVIEGAWQALSQQITDLANSFIRAVKGAFSAVYGATAAIKAAILRLDANGLRAAWGHLTGLIGGIARGVQGQLQSLYGKISGLWQGLSNRFNGMLQGLATQARAVFSKLTVAMDGIRTRLSSAWTALRNRASEMSGVLGGVLDSLRSILSRLMSWATQLWNGIQDRWSSLTAGAGSLFTSLQRRLSAAWAGLKQQASALWARVGGLWTRLKQWIGAQTGSVISGVHSFWAKISGFSIASVISKLERYGKAVHVVEKAAKDPDAIMNPMIDGIAKKLQAGMPAKAIDIGTQRLKEAKGGKGSSSAGTQTVGVQRAPASPAAAARTTDWGDVWTGFVAAIDYKWGLVHIRQMVKDMLWSLLWPWPSVGKELAGLWEDIKYSFGSLFVPRNPIADFSGFLHDLWTDVLHLLELPLALGRHLINIGMLLMGWVTIALVVIGFIGGDIAGGIIGAIAGALAGAGIGAVPGAAGGVAVGGAAGAGIGLGVALGLGQALVYGYLITQGASIAKTIVTLETGLQTEAEKDRDYGVLADSLIGVGITIVLLGIGYLASRLAGVVLGAIEGKFPPTGRFARFLGGVRSTLKPKATPGEIEPDEPGRTNKEVPGLRDAIDPTVSPDSAFTFHDDFVMDGDELVVTTEATNTNGGTADMQRGLNTKTGEIVYHYAFLEARSGEPQIPRWIQADPAMVPGKGTPLETYMTLRQLKMLSERTNVPVSISGPRLLRLSTIINERTLAQLAEATRNGTPPDEAILNTHSLQYAQNSITQSGGKIDSAHVNFSGAREVEAGTVIKRHPNLIAEHGLTPSTRIWYFFDIEVKVVPVDTTVAPKGNGLPVPPPPAVRVPEKDEGDD